jgi:chromosome segregation ATPase
MAEDESVKEEKKPISRTKWKEVAEKSHEALIEERKRAQSLEEQIHVLEATVAQRDEENRGLEEEIVNLKKQLEQERATNAMLQTANLDLNTNNGALRVDLSKSRDKFRMLETRKKQLQREVDSRRRLAGLLAAFHYAGTSLEDCHEELPNAARTLGVDFGKIDKNHVAEAYKAAGRRIHKLLFEGGLRMTPFGMARAGMRSSLSSGGIGTPASPYDSLLATLQSIIDDTQLELGRRARSGR